ncbi:efflux transporter outer membrane subunit [Paucibacter sp. KCTC 42545]|uniref:efflux transporter outer membrane subunit n=1 Tax=Paucibacter sp. KCTC 42545 TaxID=1768242 RepID=UPI000733B652|nr:efflux transporter outer membrane subunit [Paucibacter sp. KCTC 42545]ALT77224.1 hypothetical protein AT984_08510 [Paucibacter sp. KCTC 42545]
MTMRLSLLMTAALSLVACAPVPTLKPAAQAISAEQVGLSSPSQPASSPAAPELAQPQAWWQAFKDAQLDALIERALANSPSLALARARMDRAAAQVEQAQAADKPVVGAGLDMTYQRFPEHSLYPPPLAGSLRTTSTLQAGVGYDWDFFGRHQAELDTALGQGRAAQADQAAARLSLSAQVARSYLALARTLAQQELLQRQLAERKETLSLVQQRVAAGLDNGQDQRNAEAPLPELQRQSVLLDEQAAALRQQLASLSVQPAAALRELAPRLPAALNLGPEAQAQLGVDLLGRRPDVVAARWRVEAASSQVSLARAQFYPNVSLNAFVGFSSIGIDKLLQPGSLQYGLGPSIRLPLFDTGRLRAQLHGSAAELDAAVAAYNGAVIEAVREASDQLRALQSVQSQQQAQQTALLNAEASRQLQTQRFEAGLGNKLALLSARGNALQQQRQMLDLYAQQLDTQVSLVRALGGDWQDLPKR